MKSEPESRFENGVDVKVSYLSKSAVFRLCSNLSGFTSHQH